MILSGVGLIDYDRSGIHKYDLTCLLKKGQEIKHMSQAQNKHRSDKDIKCCLLVFVTYTDCTNTT